jgi:hypothetical protein
VADEMQLSMSQIASTLRRFCSHSRACPEIAVHLHDLFVVGLFRKQQCLIDCFEKGAVNKADDWQCVDRGTIREVFGSESEQHPKVTE